MKSKILFLLFFYSSHCSSQQGTATVLREGFMPFGYYEFRLDAAVIKDNCFRLPCCIKRAVVKKIPAPGGTFRHALVFEDSLSNKYVQFDADNDSLFTDEPLYRFEQMLLPGSEPSDTDYARLPVFYIYQDTTPVRAIKLCTSSTGIVYRNPLENDLYLTAYIYDYRTGTVQIGKKDYDVYLFNRKLQTGYTSSGLELLITRSGVTADPVNNRNFTFSAGDSVFLSENIFIPDSVTGDGGHFYYSVRKNTRKLNYGVVPGKTIPPVSYADAAGNLYGLYNRRLRFSLIEFWGTWCNPCLALTPYLDTVYKKFSGRIQFTGVSFDENISAVEKYNRQHKAGWRNFYQQEADQVIVQKLKISEYPSFLLVDQRGLILFRESGEEGLRKIVQFLEQKLDDQ